MQRTKILIFSDLHSDYSYMRSAVAGNPDADFVFFLGDGCRHVNPMREEFDIPFVCVRGNCDTPFDEAPLETTLIIDNYKFFLTHGDRYGVKYSMATLEKCAREKQANIALFGHTHHPHEEYVGSYECGGLWLYNPGSIGAPRDGIPTYGVLEIRSNGVLFTTRKCTAE